MTGNSTQALIPTTEEKPKSKSCSTISTRIIAYSIFSLTGSSFIYGTMVWLSKIDQNSSAASSIASPYWATGSAFVLGPAYIATLLFGKIPGQHDINNTEARKKAGNILKASWIVTASVGFLVSGALLLSNIILPATLEQTVSAPACEFLSGIAIGIAPMNLMITNIEILFKLGKPYIAPLCGIGLFTISMGANALANQYTNLGAFGVGLSGSFAQILMWLLTLIFLAQKEYQQYHFFNKGIHITCQELKDLMSGGRDIFIQRLTEYGSLLIIALISNSYGSRYSLATAPAINIISFIASVFQSIAQAGSILMIGPKTTIVNAKYDTSLINPAIKKSKKIIKVTSIFSGLASLSVAAFMILARQWISKQFITEDQQAIELSNLLLIIYGAGMIPDAFRLAFIGLNRAWSPLFEIAAINFIGLIVVAGLTSYLFSLLGQGFTNTTSNQSLDLNNSDLDINMLKNPISIVSLVRVGMTIPLAITMKSRLSYYMNKKIDKYTTPTITIDHRTEIDTPVG